MEKSSRRVEVTGEEITKVCVSISEAKSLDVLGKADKIIASVTGESLNGLEVFFLEKGDYTIRSDGEIKDVTMMETKKESSSERAQLCLISDAKDYHVIDGIPEILADGTSFTNIDIQKTGKDGDYLTRKKDDDIIYLRTNAGLIMDEEGLNEIRDIKLDKGKGRVRLYSENRKRVATVKAISTNRLILEGVIDIEFF